MTYPNKMRPMEMTVKQRVNMAACLRSDKTVEASHSEMRDSCKSTMGNQGCFMMKQRK